MTVPPQGPCQLRHRRPSHRPSLASQERGQRGSTLLELMVGLAILGVLMSLAIPGMSTILRQYNLRSAADDLMYGVNLARAQAVSNHRAYGVVIGPVVAGNPLKFNVVQGTGTACSSLVGGLIVYSADYSVGNPLKTPAVSIRGFAPVDLAKDGANLCFKTDGRVLRADTGLPFSPPNGSLLEAGDVFLELVRVDDGGGELGNAVQVQVGYNGTARLTFGHPLGQLQGGGGGN
jgi:prepilin-type N-terminal cleavage/methylation domain-containing protein